MTTSDEVVKSQSHLLSRQSSVSGEHGVHQSPIDANHSSTATVTSGVNAISDGPPTPTHSEIAECAKGKNNTISHHLFTPLILVAIPAGSPQGGSVSSLQGMSSSLQALRPQGPTITPSLANHYRDDLVNHVRGWPADILEKQVKFI